MTLKNRLAKLELTHGPQRQLRDMTDAELEAQIAALVGLPKGEPITDEMLEKIIKEANDGFYGELE